MRHPLPSPTCTARSPWTRRVFGACGRALALLLVAGCSAQPPVTTTGAPTVGDDRALAARGVQVADLDQRALLLMLADRQQLEPMSLRAQLAAGPSVREALAVALQRIGDPGGRTLLEGLLLDDVAAVRQAAAFALGELEQAAAIPALERAVTDVDAETGALAVEALGKLKAPLAEVLSRLEALGEPDASRRLLPFLFRFEGPQVVPTAERALATSDPELRAGAAYALGRQGKPEGADLLRDLLEDPVPQLRAWAARGLGEAGDADDLPLLRPLLDGTEAGPTVQALRAAGKIRQRAGDRAPAGWEPRLLELLLDPRPGVRAATLEVAGRFLPGEALADALRERARAGAPRERELALLALATARDPRAAALAAAAAGEAGSAVIADPAHEAGSAVIADPARRPSAALRARAAEAASLLGRFDLLAQLASDPEPQVRAAALEGRLHGEPAAALAAATAALGDSDPTVQATALDWLAEHPALPFERLLPAVREVAAGALEDARLSAVRALTARAASEARERGAIVAALEPLATDRSYLVRREAARALTGLGAEAPAAGPIETGKGLTAYREIVQQTAAPRFATVETERGTLRLRLECPLAPLTCLSFVQLARSGYFDGLLFHRVVPDFVVQGGDPRGDGAGGPGYALRDEINRLRYRRGAVGMALSGPDTGGSQFFFTLSPQPHLDGGYTVFATVVAGDEVLDRLEQGDRILHVREVSAVSVLP